jgi:Ulp1 family protease
MNPLQPNDHDCGLWVLSTIAAVLRGFQVTGLNEGKMLWFRAFLCSLVLALPSLPL